MGRLLKLTSHHEFILKSKLQFILQMGFKTINDLQDKIKYRLYLKAMMEIKFKKRNHVICLAKPTAVSRSLC
ncbi:hypothetical protein [Moraxella lacunata]|uniref:hypothetical protein n=1 Tax=Moraxella lacunata TaxID=477 RepID=UPI003EE3C320